MKTNSGYGKLNRGAATARRGDVLKLLSIEIADLHVYTDIHTYI